MTLSNKNTENMYRTIIKEAKIMKVICTSQDNQHLEIR